MKNIFVFIVLLALAGCQAGPSVSPTDTAKAFNEYMIRMDLEKCYSMYSSGVKAGLSFETFKAAFEHQEKEAKQDEMAAKLEYVEERIKGNNAVVYGKAMIDGQEAGGFRMRFIMENDRWMVDSEILENESMADRGYFRNKALIAVCTRYLDAMLDGDAKTLWELTSEPKRQGTDFKTFAGMTTSTSSGKKPREEGYLYDFNEAFSTDDGDGLAYVKLLMAKSQDLELASGIKFKLPFVTENGKWVADFVKIDNSYRIGDGK